MGMMVSTLTLLLALTLCTGWFSTVSHAESAGRITASGGAKVRSSASSTADVMTSYAQNAVISIRSQIAASDGYTWYEVYVDADKLGYVRSDLVEITDGSTPPASTQVTPTDTQTQQGTGADTTPAGGTSVTVDTSGVTQLNPVSATVKGGDKVRVRSTPSTSGNSQIVTTVRSGLALTVNGRADSLDNDGKTWWYVNFISDGTEVSGFIREDFVNLSEEPTPYTEPEPEETAPVEGEGSDVSAPQETKEYDTLFQDGQWLLVNNTVEPAYGYPVDELLSAMQSNNDAYLQMAKTIKTQKVGIVIVAILLVAAMGVIGLLVFKIKDITDSAYIHEVERETLHRRNGQGGQRVLQNVGAERRGTSQGQRPAGQRPAGASQGQRPGTSQGQRPAGSAQGQRPAGGPQGQRPAGTSQGQRPAGSTQGQRPAGTSQGQRPAGNTQGQRPAGPSQNQRPAGTPQGQRPQPKNFMSEDTDEFEFEFLNYDGDEQQ